MAILVRFRNGLITVKSKLHSFIVTLASLFILRGQLDRNHTRGDRAHAECPTSSTTPPESVDSNDPERTRSSPVYSTGWRRSAGSPPRAKQLPIRRGHSGVDPLVDRLTAPRRLGPPRTRFGNWIFATGGDADRGAQCRRAGRAREDHPLHLTASPRTLFATIQVLDAGSADTLRGTQKEFEAIIAAVIGGCC